MAEPHFYLKDKKSKDTTLIVLHWLVDGRRFRFSTSEQVRPMLWSAKKERVLPRHPFADTINSKLDRIERAAREQYEALAKDAGFIVFDDLRKAISIAIAKKKSGNDVFSYYESFCEAKKEKPNFKNQSLKAYNSAIMNLRSFCDYRNMPGLDFSQVNVRFLEDFESYLLRRDLSNNYVHKTLSKVSAIFRQAVRDGISDNSDFEKFTISVSKETSTAIYLNASEIKAMHEYDFTGQKRLEKVRDVFVAACLTGLRYSDYRKISIANIRNMDGFDFLVVLSQKTEEQVFIPINDTLQSILDKYKGTLPVISDVKMNQYLKEVGTHFDFLRSTIDKVISIGGRKTSTPMPRYELLSTHTARRSFATNAYLEGWDLKSIRMITGHSNNEMLEKYIRVTKRENAVRMASEMKRRQQSNLQGIIDALNEALKLDVLDDRDKDDIRRVLGKMG